MSLHRPSDPPSAEVADAAACLTGSPDQLAAQLRALLDEGAPKPTARESADARREREAETAAHERTVAALRHRLASDFAGARGWVATVAPLAVRELARRSGGGNWQRQPREWLGTLFSLTFYRDARRRAAAAVAHPLAEVAERDRIEIELWAAERDLTVTFFPGASWIDPGRNTLAVFEPAEPAEQAAPAAAPQPSASEGVEKRDIGCARSEATKPEISADLSTERPLAACATRQGATSDPVAKIDTAPPTAPAAPVMRPVAPIDLDGATPADLDGQDAPSWDLVPPTELLVDEAYQRDLTPKSLALVRRIARSWSWAKFKAPVVVRVDGALHVIDGQHTAIGAATHGGIPLIPVLVVAAPDLADRAEAFISHATERLPTTIVQVHRAAVLAGDEDAVTIDRVCHAAGIDLVAFPPARSAYRPRQTIALNAIRRVVDKRGAMRARQILEALAHADLAPISADHIRAAEALLCDPDLSGEVDAERVTAGMRALAAKGYTEAKTLAATKNLVLWRAMVAVILKAKKVRPKGGRHADEASTHAEGEAA